MNFDYAVHSDFLIHWTGKDLDKSHDPEWYNSPRSETEPTLTDLYIKRLHNILRFGLWMTEEQESELSFGDERVSTPPTPKVCFTELKLSESRIHAQRYGRLVIGVKRRFLFDRSGRPLLYYWYKGWEKNDPFLEACAKELQNKDLLNFFKPMDSRITQTLTYDLYRESEWRIIYFKELLEKKWIKDPRDSNNTKEHEYFNSLTAEERSKLRYLIPLDGWFAVIIYPSIATKNKGQQEDSTGVKDQTTLIKKLPDRGNLVEGNNWPIELDLDACRNF